MALLPPYGVAINDAIKTGDLSRMKQVAADTEKWLADQKAVGDALADLKKQISALEKKSRK